MNNISQSRIFQLIQTMSEEEHNTFQNSAYYHDRRVSESVIILYHYLLESGDKDQSLEKETIHKVVFKQKKYSENRLNKLMNSLHELIEDFLVIYICDSEFQRNMSLAKYYREKGKENRFGHFITHIEKQHSQLQIKNKLFYLNEFLILNEKYATNLFLDSDIKKINNLTNVIESLDIFYIITKFEYVSSALSEFYSIKLDLTNAFFNLDTLLKDSKYGDISLIKLFKNAILLLSDIIDDEKFVFDFYESLEENENAIEIQQYKNFHTYIRSYYVKKYNGGNKEVLPILFEIQKKQLSKGIILINNKINAVTLIAIIEVAYKLKEYEWAKKCIETYREKVFGNNSEEEIYQFNLANYYFNTKQYDKVLDTQFHFISFENIFIALAAKRIEIKLYYEMQELNLLEARLESFKVWLHRNAKEKIAPMLYENNNTFVNIVKQMLSSNIEYDKMAKSKLHNKIDKISKIAEREWLLEKLSSDILS